MKSSVWFTVSVETVIPNTLRAEEESSSMQIEVEDIEVFKKKLGERDKQVEELQR